MLNRLELCFICFFDRRTIKTMSNIFNVKCNTSAIHVISDYWTRKRLVNVRKKSIPKAVFLIFKLYHLKVFPMSSVTYKAIILYLQYLFSKGPQFLALLLDHTVLIPLSSHF